MIFSIYHAVDVVCHVLYDVLDATRHAFKVGPRPGAGGFQSTSQVSMAIHNGPRMREARTLIMQDAARARIPTRQCKTGTVFMPYL